MGGVILYEYEARTLQNIRNQRVIECGSNSAVNALSLLLLFRLNLCENYSPFRFRRYVERSRMQIWMENFSCCKNFINWWYFIVVVTVNGIDWYCRKWGRRADSLHWALGNWINYYQFYVFWLIENFGDIVDFLKFIYSVVVRWVFVKSRPRLLKYLKFPKSEELEINSNQR